jgi:hypothetical protein
MGIPEQNPMMSEAKIRASGSSVGKNSTVQSQSVSSCQYGSKSSLAVRSQERQTFNSGLYVKTRGTRTVQAKPVPALVVPYRALQCDRCLVITT